MTHQRVVVEVHLTIYRNDLLIACLEQRVDLQHGAIQPDIGIIKIRDEFNTVF